MTSVLVVDDQPLIRSAIVALLDREADIDVIGEASDGAEALRFLGHTVPDVVLMDIRMPHLDGIETTTRICADQRFRDLKVLILTTFEKDEYVLAALRAGASGFIGKSVEPEELAEAVRKTHAGTSLLSPAATKTLIETYLEGGSRAASPTVDARQALALNSLTSREREVLILAARGQTNGEIADTLVISPTTAKTHINRIMAKTGARDRVQLVIFAYETGLIAPGPEV